MEKQELRERIWDELEESGESRFPYPPHGRIPNFNGADEAAERLAANEAWQEADVIKSNPDSPQLPVRRTALRQGKTIYMAVPRLREEKCFLRLDPEEIEDINHATTIGGSSEVGVQVGPDEMESIDLIVSGSVAVNKEGARIGKGEGYSDLEFAVLREFDLVDDDTPTATTVHEIQVVEGEASRTPRANGDAASAPSSEAHDVPMDLIVTPDRTIRSEPREKPPGIDRSLLSEERLDEIPVLRRLEGR